MKNQRFRYKIVALLLMGLIVLAGVYGARNIPLADASGSLRDAILRLTGQEVPSASPLPDEFSSEEPSPGMDEPNAQPSDAVMETMQENPADTDPAPVRETPDPGAAVPTPVPDNSLGSIVSPDVTAPPSPGAAVPLSEALSNYFDGN